MLLVKSVRQSHLGRLRSSLYRLVASKVAAESENRLDDKMEWLSPSKKRRRLIASIDQGTSSSRFMVVDKYGGVVAKYQV